MESSLLPILIRTTLAASCAIVLVLLGRRPVRAWLGARAAYPLWLLVPLMMLAAAAPSLRVSRTIAVATVPALPLGQMAAPVAASVPVQWDAVLLALWFSGALAAAMLFLSAHRRYSASLGALTGDDGLFVAATSAQGPALLGLWRPRIVLPADFAQRYSASEQALIIAHERRHARRGDPIVNAVIAALQCAFWFNPLMHLAAARCRFDQELACDADILAQHPGQAKAYAAAMLKTQTGAAFAPITCHWQSRHPLKERIMQLNRSTTHPARRLAGKALLAVLLAAGVTGTMAARAEPAKKNTYLVDFKMTFAGEYSTPSVLIATGEPFTMSGTRNGKTWSGDFLLTEGKDGELWLKNQFSFDGKKGGVHNAGMRPGARHQIAIMDEANNGAMIMVIDEGITAVPKRD